MRDGRLRRCAAGASVGLALLAHGCALLGGDSFRAASPEEQQAYQRALSVLSSNPKAAAARFEVFVTTWPKSPLADDAAYQLAQLALTDGEPETAVRQLYFIVERHPRGNRAPTARIRLAHLERSRGDAEAARRLLSKVRLSRVSEQERRQAHRLWADLSEDPVMKLRWLALVRADARDRGAIALVDAEIDEILPELSRDDVERAADQIGRRIPAGRLRVREAALALDEEDLRGAERALKKARGLPLSLAYADRIPAAATRLRLHRIEITGDEPLPTLREVADRPLPSTDDAEGVVGVVLPLSGRFARFGEESLNGILLAAGIFDATLNRSEDELADAGGMVGGMQAGSVPAAIPGEAEFRGRGIRLVVRDSGGRTGRAAEAVRDLASDRDVAAILGPLRAAEAEAAAAVAERAEIPLLTLTTHEEVARERDYVFRVRTTPSEEVAGLVEYAMEDLGATRFAILYPLDSYGRGLRSLFWNAVEARGGAVVGVAGYSPDATDFAEPIRRLAGYVLLSDEENETIETRQQTLRRAKRLPPDEAVVLREEARGLTGPHGQPLPPIVDFDALFIPDSHEKIVLIAPQLAFHEVTGARLLGPNGWNHPDLVRIARRHVEGAVFTAAFHGGSKFSFVEEFAWRYEETFGTRPDHFAAQAFDAANLVMIQLAQGLRSRAAVREGLLSTQGYPGVAGVTSMRRDGNSRKRPYLLAVRRGRVVSLE